MGRWTRVGLVVLSAGLLALCFPPVGAWPLLVVALVPLLLAMQGVPTPREAFYLGILHGVALYAGTIYWLFRIFTAAAIPLFYILALFTGVFCILLRALFRREWSPWVTVPLIAMCWTGLEFYRSELFILRFPWISTGSALGPTWLSPLVGVYGATFLIVLATAGLFYRKTWWPAAALAVGVLALGVFRPGKMELGDQEGFPVAIVQSEEGNLDAYADLTQSVAADHPALVVWPEYSLPYDVRRIPGDMKRLLALGTDLDATLVVGTQTVIGPGAKEWRNTALTLNGSGVLGEYYKARPVHFFNDGIAGTVFDPIMTPLGAIGTPVCFDCDNASVTRAITARGAECFAVPIFDSQSWGAIQHEQHAALIRLRAAENARWFACAASSGVSQIIDPHGQVHASLPPLTTGATVARIACRTGRTFFTRIGWLFPWLTLAVTGGVILWAVGSAWIAKRKRG